MTPVVLETESKKSGVHFMNVHKVRTLSGDHDLHLPAPAHVSEAVLTSLLSVGVGNAFVVSRTAVTIHEATVGERCLHSGGKTNVSSPEKYECACVSRRRLRSDRKRSGSHQWCFKVGQN